MDFSTHKKTTSDSCAVAVVALVMLATTAFASEPASKPTPRPGTLGAYAETNPGVSAARVRGLRRRLLVGMSSYPFRVREPDWKARARDIVEAARALPGP